jgi:hypothetical protein
LIKTSRQQECVLEVFHTWWTGSRQKIRKGAKDNVPPRISPQYLLPPARPHLLKVPELSKIAGPAGHQEFKTQIYGRIFHIQTITVSK